VSTRFVRHLPGIFREIVGKYPLQENAEGKVEPLAMAAGVELGMYPLQENAEGKVEDARGGLSTAELSPAIILSESFAGH